MGTTYKGIYLPAASETGWDDEVNANWTLLADREERIRKSSNESVTSSTTLQNDDALVYTMIANHTWAFKLVVLAQTTAGTALKSNFTVPAAATWSYLGTSALGGVVGRDSTTSATDFISGANSTTAEPILYDGIVTCGATAGDFQYRWAQNASSGTALTVTANSYLLMKLLV